MYGSTVMKRSINIDARFMAVFFYVHIELRGRSNP